MIHIYRETSGYTGAVPLSSMVYEDRDHTERESILNSVDFVRLSTPRNLSSVLPQRSWIIRSLSGPQMNAYVSPGPRIHIKTDLDPLYSFISVTVNRQNGCL